MSRLRAGCPNKRWTTFDAIAPHLGRIVIDIREAGRVSAEWVARHKYLRAGRIGGNNFVVEEMFGVVLGGLS